MAPLGFSVAFAVDGLGHMTGGLQEDTVGVGMHFLLTFLYCATVRRTAPVFSVDHTFICIAHIPDILPRFQNYWIKGGYSIEAQFLSGFD